MAFDRGVFHHGQPIGHGQCKQQRSGGEHMVCADLLVIQHDDLAGDGHEGAKGGKYIADIEEVVRLREFKFEVQLYE